MRKLSAYLLCFLVLILPGCGMLTPQQRESARQSLDNALQNGQLTQAEHDAAVEQLNKTGSFDWNPIVGIGVALAGALLGVPISVGVIQKKRGPVATVAERVARTQAGS